MTTPAIITVAITGNITTKEMNPAVPTTIEEQVESTQGAFEAGATVAHVHVRDDEGKPCVDADRYGRLQEGLLKHCPGMIIQFSTGARCGNGESRADSFVHNPEMCSLSVGSVNLNTVIYANELSLVEYMCDKVLAHNIKPEVEIFDVSDLYTTKRLIDEGKITTPVHVQFVTGIKGAIPSKASLLEFLVKELKEEIPDCTWVATGVGRHQEFCNRWSLERGGHVRTGLEDNIWISKGVLAKDNAELVAKTAGLCAEYDRHPASVEEARQILGLKSFAAKVAANG
jgi:uncharacterized protein (DUF849 family)